MMLLGSPDLCPCGASGCVEVDGIVWLCERCADVITREYRKSYPVTAAAPLAVVNASTVPAASPAVEATISSDDGAARASFMDARALRIAEASEMAATVKSKSVNSVGA